MGTVKHVFTTSLLFRINDKIKIKRCLYLTIILTIKLNPWLAKYYKSYADSAAPDQPAHPLVLYR